MNAMRPCHLQISTRADGEEESLFSAEAEMELAPQSALLRYRQGEGVSSSVSGKGKSRSNGKGTIACGCPFRKEGRCRAFWELRVQRDG